MQQKRGMKRKQGGGRGPPAKRRPGKGREIDQEEVLRKKSYAHIKELKRAVKKAKQFEIQKVVRRLKQAKEGAEGDVAKLESQLVAVRGADLDRLAHAAAASVGVAPDGAPMEPATSELGPLERRMVSAKCVVDQLEAMVAAIKAIKAKAQQQRAAAEGDEGEEPAPKRKKDVSNSSGGDEEAPGSPPGSEPSSSSEGEPDEDALAALAKLTDARRGGAHPADDASESSDSGVIEDLSDEELEELEAELGGGSEPGTSGADDTDDGQAPPSKKGKEAQPKKQPKKPKNRLGQRARRALAEQQHGHRAVHLHTKKKEAKEDPPKAEELHPSWAARRQQNEKLSISAVAPSGKKIVFDADGGGAKRIIAPAGGKERPGKKEKVTETATEGSGLHPSWELRKKQAEAQRLLPAQGTKIVFDDSD